MEVCVPESEMVMALALSVEAQKMEGKTKVVVTLRAQGVYAEEERAPFKLVISADKSGSMAQSGKMEAMKDTIHAVVKHLNVKDELGIVTFDAGYTQLQELRPLEKDSLADKILAMRVGSTTNLSGGLFAAMDMLKDTQGVVLLLTDGLPNEGLTSAEAILNTMEQLKVNAVVHTFGYGADHCADLLQSIAASTGGKYFYIDDRKENVRNSLAEALGVCLGSVASTVAQVVKVTLTMESGELGTVYTHSGNVVHVGDMGFGDERNIVFDVFGETPVVHVDVTYVDVVTGYAGLCHTAHLADAPEFNAVVEVQRLRLSVGHCISLVSEGAAGMVLLNEVMADVDGNMERCANPVLEKFKNDLEVCVEGIHAPKGLERGVSAAMGRNYEQEMYLPTPSQVQWTRSLSQPADEPPTFEPFEIPELARCPPPPTLRRAETRHNSSDF